MLTQIISLGLNFIFSIIFTRILGPNGRGIFAVFVASANIIVYLGSLGFPTAHAFYGAQDERNIPKLFSNSIILTLIFSAASLVLLYQFPVLQARLGIPASYSNLGVLFFSINLPLAFLSQLVRDLLLAKHWFVQYNLSNLGAVLAYGVFGLSLAAILPDKLMAILLANALSALLPVVITLWFLFPLLHWDLSADLFKKSLFVGWRVYLINLITLILSRLNVFMLSSQLGSKPTGLYSTALSLSELIATLPIAAVPVIFAYTATNEREGIRLALRTNRIVIILVFLVNILMGLLAVPLLNIYGAEFTQARIVLLVLLPGVQFYATTLVLRSYFQGMGYPILTLLIPFTGLILHYGLNTLLIPQNGMVGAALSLSIVYFWMMLLSVVLIRYREPGVTWSQMFVLNSSEILNYLEIVKRSAKKLRGSSL